MSALDSIESRCLVHINRFLPLSLWSRLKQIKKLIVFLVLPLSLLSLILANDVYAIDEGNTTETVVQKSVRFESQAGEGTAAPTSLVDATELDKKRRLLQKAIKDIDSFRTTFKYLDSHNDYESRVLLLLETDKYIDDYVNPLLLDESLVKNKDIFPLVAHLEFMKALMYFEAGDHNKFKEIIDNMRKQFGREHLGVLVAPFNEAYSTIGEGILFMEKKVRSMKNRLP